eukprot:scaffold3440_cov316-Prasinococcus_capsulatus_cf.AAC.6
MLTSAAAVSGRARNRQQQQGGLVEARMCCRVAHLAVVHEPRVDLVGQHPEVVLLRQPRHLLHVRLPHTCAPRSRLSTDGASVGQASSCRGRAKAAGCRTWGMTPPVGLLGLFSTSSLVRLDSAPRSASICSDAPSAVSGTGLGTPPAPQAPSVRGRVSASQTSTWRRRPHARDHRRQQHESQLAPPLAATGAEDDDDNSSLLFDPQMATTHLRHAPWPRTLGSPGRGRAPRLPAR